MKNGFFSFSGYADLPTRATLTGNIKSNLGDDDPNYTTIFLEPGNIKAVIIQNDFKNSKVTGSQTQVEAEILNSQKEHVTVMENESGMMLKEINSAQQKGDTSSALKSKRAILWDKYLKSREQEKQIDYTFIITHPNSYLSPYLMGYYFGTRKLPLDSAELFFKSFNKSVQNSLYGKSINNQITARKLSATGSPATLFSKIDMNDKDINLQSFRGKSYVLLDFWASWCVPCRAITPGLKEVYQKYHSMGLDVVSISWDSDKKAWTDAINKDSTNSWYHIFANLSLGSDNGLREKYAIASIPTLILIDKNGKIIGRYRGDGEDGDETALYQKIASIFTIK